MITVAELGAKIGADTSGFEKGVRDADAGLKKFASNVSSALSGIGGALTVGLTIPIAAVASQFVKLGMEFDDAFDKIRIGTGATGAALAGLQESFRNVVRDVPASFENASIAITQLAQRTGVTGQALETLSKQELELARMTGSQLAPQIEATSQVFTNWAGVIKDPTAALDTLFKVSQQTGIGVTELAQDMTKAGAPLRALGLGFDQSAVLIGQFDKAGIDAGKTTMALTRSLSEMAKKGITDPAEAFKLLIDRIKNATSETTALAEANKIFGARAGVQMVDAIKAGRFSLDDLTRSLQDNKESILGAAADTKDFSEKLREMQNRVKLAAEPLANEFFNAVNQAMPKIEGLIGSITKLVKWFLDLPGPVKTSVAAIAGIGAIVGPVAIAAGAIINAIGRISTAYNAARDAAIAFRAASIGGGAAGLAGVAAVPAAAGLGAFLAGSAQWEKSKAQFEASVEAMGTKYNRFGEKVMSVNDAIAQSGTQKLTNGLVVQLTAKIGEATKEAEKHAEGATKAGEKADKAYNKMFGGGSGAASGVEEMRKHAEKVIESWEKVRDAAQKMDLDSRKDFEQMALSSEGWLNATTKHVSMFDLEMSDAGQAVHKMMTEASADFEKLSEEAEHTFAGRIIEALRKTADEVRAVERTWGEGLGSMIIGVGEMAGKSTETIAKWSTDIGDIVRTMPGHFGDAVRGVLRTVNQWVEFGNSVLKVLHSLNEDIPDSVGGLVKAIVGQFKDGFQTILDSFKSFGSTLLNGIKSIMGAAGGLGQILIGGGLIAGSTQVGGIGGHLMGAGGGALVGAKIGSMIAPGIGTAIGAIGGAIFGGLFGGKKSEAQKKQEEDAKKAAEINTATAIANLNQGIIDGLEKGRQLLENLSTFVEVPKQALKKFFKQLQTLLTDFVEMASQFKSDGLAKAKEVTEALGPVFEFLAGAVNFTKIARESEEVTDESIAKLMSAISRLEAGFEAITAKLEMSVVKRSAKMAEKLTSVFGFISIIPDALKKVNETPDVTDEILASIFASATKIIDKFAELIDQFEVYSFNKLAKSSKQFQGVFEAVSAILGSLKSIGEFQPMAEGVLDVITSDLQKVLTALQTWTDLGMQALEKSLSFEDVMRRLKESMSRGLGSLASLTQASSSGSSIRTQTTNIDQRISIGGVTVAPGQPGYQGLVAAVAEIQRALGGVQQIARAY